MGKIFRSRNKAEEKEDEKLYKLLKVDISEIREVLKWMYLVQKDGHEDSIHGMVVRLDRVNHSLFTYIFDGHSAKVTLEERNGESKKESNP